MNCVGFTGVIPFPMVSRTSLKMGVTKADKDRDLGCLFTESPDCKQRMKAFRGGKKKQNHMCVRVCICPDRGLTSESVCV